MWSVIVFFFSLIIFRERKIQQKFISSVLCWAVWLIKIISVFNSTNILLISSCDLVCDFNICVFSFHMSIEAKRAFERISTIHTYFGLLLCLWLLFDNIVIMIMIHGHFKYAFHMSIEAKRAFERVSTNYTCFGLFWALFFMNRIDGWM